MSKVIKLRLVGAAILLFNLWMVGRFNMHGPAVAVITIGFVIAYERFVVGPAKKEPHQPIESAKQSPQQKERREDQCRELANEADQIVESPLPSIGGVVFVSCVMIGIVALMFFAASSPS